RRPDPRHLRSCPGAARVKGAPAREHDLTKRGAYDDLDREDERDRDARHLQRDRETRPPTTGPAVPSRRRVLLASGASLWGHEVWLRNRTPDLDPHVGPVAAHRDGAQHGAPRGRIERGRGRRPLAPAGAQPKRRTLRRPRARSLHGPRWTA